MLTNIAISVQHDTNGLTRDDFYTSSADDDSDVEITSGEHLDGKKSSPPRETEKEPVVVAEVVKKELTPEIVTPEDMLPDELLVEGVDPRPLHKTCSIFLRNIHPSVFRSQIEEVIFCYPCVSCHMAIFGRQ